MEQFIYLEALPLFDAPRAISLMRRQIPGRSQDTVDKKINELKEEAKNWETDENVVTEERAIVIREIEGREQILALLTSTAFRISTAFDVSSALFR